MTSPPMGAPNAGEVSKNFVVLAEDGRGVCGVINYVGGSRSLLITLIAHLISTTLVAMKGCLSHARLTSALHVCDTKHG